MSGGLRMVSVATLLAGTALTSAPAMAQQAAAAPASSSGVGEIVITGSRVQRPGLQAPNPITTVNAQQIELTGVTSAIDLVTRLPQTQLNVGGSNNQRFVNGAGINLVNLRGLGETRTLTLVDGVRSVGTLSGRNGSGGTLMVDTNTIAPELIDRVDIVTGGASAIYGSDAVAGVINFILKKDFEGARLRVGYAGAQHGGDNTPTVGGLLGANFADGRGNVTVGVDWQRDDGVFANQRSYAMCNHTLVTNPASKGPHDGIPDRISIACTNTSYIAANGAPVITSAIGANNAYTLTVKPDGSGLAPFDRGQLINPPTSRTAVGDTDAIGGAGVNQSNYLTLRSPNTRVIVNPILNYRLADKIGPFQDVNFFGDLKYVNSRGQTMLPPLLNGNATPGSAASAALAIASDNPYMPADLKGLLTSNNLSSFAISRLNADWFPRLLNYDYQIFRSVTGVRGSLANDWKYEAYFNYGRNVINLDNTDLYESRFLQQIDAVRLSDGSIVCRDTSARAQGCAPINPFVVGPLSAAQSQYAYLTTHEHDVITQSDAAINLHGDLIHYRPLGSSDAKPLGFAVGYEWRKEEGNSQPDYLEQRGLNYNNQLSAVVGSYTTSEVYAELSGPLVADLPLMKSFDVDVAARFQDYSTTGKDWTWNVRGNWEVVDGFKLRAGAARAVRAPNIDELFSPIRTNLTGVNDPCSVENINTGPNPSARLTNCRAQGVPVGFNQAAYPTVVTYRSGNLGLKPEVGNTVTAGVVFTPTFVPRLSITADFWQVLISNGIQSLAANSIASNCYDTGTVSSNVFCPLLTRRSDGSLASVLQQVTNVANETVRGVDFEVNYRALLDDWVKLPGSLNLNWTGSWVPENYVIAVPGVSAFNVYRAGTVGYPRLKWTGNATYERGPLSVSWTTRYIGPSILFPASGPEDADFNEIHAYWYHDLSARYRVNQRISLTAGINNLFDVNPPQVPYLYSGSKQSFGALTAPATGDAASTYSNQGRFFFGSITIDF